MLCAVCTSRWIEGIIVPLFRETWFEFHNFDFILMFVLKVVKTVFGVDATVVNYIADTETSFLLYSVSCNQP